MKKFVLYSTLFGVFSEALVLKLGIDLKPLYLIALFNFPIFFIKNKTFFFPKNYLFIACYVILLGLICSLAGTDNVKNIIEQVGGIAATTFYFYNFFIYINTDVEIIFEKYLKVVYILSIIGIVIFIYQMLTGHTEYRLQSLLLEPAHFAGISLAAFYFSLKNYKKFKKECKIITLALVLSGSSIAYLGVLVSLFIFRKKFITLRSSIIYIFAIVIGIGTYSVNDNVRMRVDDTFTSAATFDVSNSNWSTYALVSNAFITAQVLKNNFLTGFGIGSHELSHEKYIYKLSGVEQFSLIPDLNAKDANSLALRVLSDFGVIGLIAVLTFIVTFYSSSNTKYVMSRALLVYFFYKLLREGHYFSPEMYFFVFLYYFNYKQEIGARKQDFLNSIVLTV